MKTKDKKELIVTAASIIITVILLLVLSVITIESFTMRGFFEKSQEQIIMIKANQIARKLLVVLTRIETSENKRKYNNRLLCRKTKKRRVNK